MASFIASRTSRANGAVNGNDSHTLKENDTDTLQADIAALTKATLANAGPILLRLLQSVEFREYVMENGVTPSGVCDCAYTYMYNGVFVVDTPTRPASPIAPTSPIIVMPESTSAITTATTRIGGGGGGGLQASGVLVREGPEGSSPFSTHSNLLFAGGASSSYGLEVPNMDVDVLAYLKGLAIVESGYSVGGVKVSDPKPSALMRFPAAGAGASSHQ